MVSAPVYEQPSSSDRSLDVGQSPRPDVSVVIVNYNTAHLLVDMWSALMASKSNLSLEIVIVDNASRDDSVRLLRSDARFALARLIVNETNIGFGRANNQGLQYTTGRHILLLNTDAFVSADTLPKTVDYIDAHPECGVLGVRLVGRDGSVQPSCRYFPTPANLFLWRTGLYRLFPRARMVDDMQWDHAAPRKCDWVPGCYLLIRREVIDAVGLFDPRYFLYSEEVDFCRRVKSAGWEISFFGDTSVVHLGGESAKSDAVLTGGGQQIAELQIESELLYMRKHHGAIGVVAFVLLSWLADFIQAAKWLAKGHPIRGGRVVMHHATALASLFLRTRLGSLPTR